MSAKPLSTYEGVRERYEEEVVEEVEKSEELRDRSKKDEDDENDDENNNDISEIKIKGENEVENKNIEDKEETNGKPNKIVKNSRKKGNKKKKSIPSKSKFDQSLLSPIPPVPYLWEAGRLGGRARVVKWTNCGGRGSRPNWLGDK